MAIFDRWWTAPLPPLPSRLVQLCRCIFRRVPFTQIVSKKRKTLLCNFEITQIVCVNSKQSATEDAVTIVRIG